MNNTSYLYKAAAFVLFVALSLLLVVNGKSFLAPLTLAAILSLLILPVARKLEHLRLNRSLACLCCTLVIFVVSCGFFALVTAQMNQVVEKWETMKETIKPKIETATHLITENTPVSDERLAGYKEKIKSLKFIGSGSGGSSALTYIGKLVGFLGMYVLVFIYVFFMLRFRSKFKEFILKYFSEEKKSEVKKTIQQTITVAQGYLLGKLKLIALLAVLYCIGMGISGVSNFILIALIAAALTIIPYLGNVIGFSLALIFGYLIDGEVGVLIGVGITFVVTQFVESYILQPYVVGKDVDLNPLFVILAVVLGNILWGIMGMVVAIPVLAIINVIFLHIPNLKPFGFLMSKDTDKK